MNELSLIMNCKYHIGHERYRKQIIVFVEVEHCTISLEKLQEIKCNRNTRCSKCSQRTCCHMIDFHEALKTCILVLTHGWVPYCDLRERGVYHSVFR